MNPFSSAVRRISRLFLALMLLCIFPSCGSDPSPSSSSSDAVPPPPVSSSASSSAASSSESTSPPTQQTDRRIAAVMDAMTLEEKVGQLFFVRCPENGAVEKISAYHPGGYILFGRDFKGQTVSSIVETIRNYQQASSIRMLIGVDEEGGEVNRISLNKAFRAYPFLSPQTLFAKGGMDLIRTDTIEKTALLKSLGVNTNFAPVCDVSTNNKDYIYRRSFGKSAQETASYVSTVVSTMKGQGVGSVLKHFPGYGNNVDTHTGIAVDHRTYDTFLNSDFLPFRAGIAAGADTVLVSHNIVVSVDSVYPASLSPLIHKILREDLSFHGVIITDDLAMDAIQEYTKGENAAVLAVLAGNDMICTTDFETDIPEVIAAVQKGTLSEEQIDTALYRVLQWKLDLGLL